MGNILMHNELYNIQQKALTFAAGSFLTSAQFAGVIKNGMLSVLDATMQTPETPMVDEDQEFASMPPAPILQNVNPITSVPPPLPIKTDDFVFDFDGGIRLTIPKTKITSDAIADGELKEARRALKEFAQKCLLNGGESEQN